MMSIDDDDDGGDDDDDDNDGERDLTAGFSRAYA